MLGKSFTSSAISLQLLPCGNDAHNQYSAKCVCGLEEGEGNTQRVKSKHQWDLGDKKKMKRDFVCALFDANKPQAPPYWLEIKAEFIFKYLRINATHLHKQGLWTLLPLLGLYYVQKLGLYYVFCALDVELN